MECSIYVSQAPYMRDFPIWDAVREARNDGFSGIELFEDYLLFSVGNNHGVLKNLKCFNENSGMGYSVHSSILTPSPDSENEGERRKAVEKSMLTLDYMHEIGADRLIMHSCSDLPSIFHPRRDRPNRAVFEVGKYLVRAHGMLAPALRAYREMKNDVLEAQFKKSLVEISKYADEKGIKVVYEEHYAEGIDHSRFPFGRNGYSNVIPGVDTAHHLIKHKNPCDFSCYPSDVEIWTHAVDTDGMIDDHRAIGTGRVDFGPSLRQAAERKLSKLVLENSTRAGAVRSRDAIASIARKI